jgi:hypothetical protein
VQVTVTGDDKLYASYQAHLNDIGTAINLTTAIATPIGNLAKKGAATFSAIGDIGVAGATCAAAQTSVIANVQASVSVSVSASASVSSGS